MKHAVWAARYLFLGRIEIGRVSGEWKDPGPNGENWIGFSLLPGAKQVLGPFADEKTAKEMVYKSANSRIKGLFGAGIDTTATAVREGRKLRVIARAIWRAGVWSCDRKVDAKVLFDDLGKAVGFAPDEAPKRNPDAKDAELARSDVEVIAGDIEYPS